MELDFDFTMERSESIGSHEWRRAAKNALMLVFLFRWLHAAPVIMVDIPF
jgi:hypothetical protein